MYFLKFLRDILICVVFLVGAAVVAPIVTTLGGILLSLGLLVLAVICPVVFLVEYFRSPRKPVIPIWVWQKALFDIDTHL